MEPALNFFAVINTLGGLQCILTALALFSIKTGNRTANRTLAVYLISLAIYFLEIVMYDTQFFLLQPHLFGIFNRIILAMPPLLFLYIKSVADPEYEFAKNKLWHFLPFTIFVLLSLPDILATSAEAKLRTYLAELNAVEITISEIIIFKAIDIFFVTYILASFRVLHKAISRYGGSSPQGVMVNLKLLRYLLIATLFASLTGAIFDFFPEDDHNYDITPFIVTVTVYCMAYVGIRQSELFTADKLGSMSRKYQKSALTDEKAGEILAKLTHLMKDEKLFKESDVSLPGLARRLHISTHLLSQILNERLDRNFFNFISEYRVQEAQKKLLEPESERFTMLELAYEVGFNSLSAFNTAFKKHAGMSPSEFKKQHWQEGG